MLQLQPLDPYELVSPTKLRLGTLSHAEKPGLVPVPHAVCFSGLDQLVGRVLPDRLEKSIPRSTIDFLNEDERLAHEAAQQVEDLGLADERAATDGFGCLEADATRENRQPAQ